PVAIAAMFAAACGVLTALPADAAPSANVRFAETKLVSNIAGAKHRDPDLVNPWGGVIGSDGFFWVADNGSGKATLYDGTGKKSSLVVSLPNPTGPDPSTPTGQVTNKTSSLFLGDTFIFDTEDGTILGWNGGTDAVVRSDQSSGG